MRLANREVLLVRSAAIYDDLPGLRPGSRHQGERVEFRLRRVDAESEIGRSTEGDRFTIVADQVGVTLDLADGRIYVGQGRDPVEHGLVERRRRVGAVPLVAP